MKKISLLCCLRIVVLLLKHALFKANTNIHNDINFLNPNNLNFNLFLIAAYKEKNGFTDLKNWILLSLEYFKNSSVNSSFLLL